MQIFSKTCSAARSTPGAAGICELGCNWRISMRLPADEQQSLALAVAG
jgi:hypothetical protein